MNGAGTATSIDMTMRQDASSTLVLRRPPRPSLADLAYEAVVEAIVDRRIKPGARIGIDPLAMELEMSATPIREALARAAAKRLVVQVSNRGFTVTPLLSEREYHQLWDVRYLLEIHAIRAARSSDERITQLATIVDRMPLMEHGPIYRDFKEFSEADREFHHTLVAMAGNDFLLRAWDDLHFHLHVGRLYAGAGLVDFDDALREHAAIADHLVAGQREAAMRELAHHIKRAEQRLVDLVTRNGSAQNGEG